MRRHTHVTRTSHALVLRAICNAKRQPSVDSRARRPVLPAVTSTVTSEPGKMEVAKCARLLQAPRCAGASGWGTPYLAY